jgi:hypothetical protein
MTLKYEGWVVDIAHGGQEALATFATPISRSLNEFERSQVSISLSHVTGTL